MELGALSSTTWICSDPNGQIENTEHFHLKQSGYDVFGPNRLIQFHLII